MNLNINAINTIDEYTNGDAEKIALASSAFVNGAASLCTFIKKLKENNNNVLENFKKAIKENGNKESELTTNLYNEFYSDDNRMVL